MKEILPIYIVCILLAFLSHRSSLYDYRLARYKYKDRLFYAVIIVLTVIFAGMRTDYNDTAAYIRYYSAIETSAGWLSEIDWSVSEYPLFRVLNKVFKITGFSAQSFVLIYSAFSIGVFLWFIRKYTEDITLSIFLFFTMGCYVFAMAAIKQCTATACCLLGIDRLLSTKHAKYIRFFLWVTVGMLFHPFSAMFYLCPFLTFSPWTLPSYLMIIVCAVGGYSLQTWLSSALDLLSMVGIEYDETSALSESVNVLRVLVLWSPILLSFLSSKFWVRSKNKADNLLLNLSTLCAEIMFIALFGNPLYFGRLANYFLLFQTISLPFVLRFFEENSKQVLKSIIFLGYSIFAVYREALRGTTFDARFSRITLWQYLGF